MFKCSLICFTGCIYDGSRHQDGETFTASDNPCVQCKCEGKNVKCTRQVCPVLSCPDTHQRTQPGQCCPSCIVQRRVFELGNKCIYKTDVFEDGEVIIVDKCTRCTCIDTTFMCHRQVCPDTLPCSVNEQVVEEGSCCPKCRRKTCQVDDKIFEDGDTWLQSPCEECKCTDEGVVCTVKQCQQRYKNCPRNHEFKTPLGECCPRCIEKNGVCTVYGDPHYQTFDLKSYSFQGNCKYMLAKDCVDKSFAVKVKNDDRNTGLYSWTKQVFFNVGDFNIVLLPYYKVKVNGQLISLPYSIRGVDISKENTLITVKTDIGVYVSWDGDSFAEVEVDTSFKGKLCGLCGNYNDDGSDDFTSPDGRIIHRTNDFVKTWQVGKNSCEKKQKDEPPKTMNFPCQAVSSEKRMKAHMMCKVLKSDSFKACREEIDYMNYHRSCIVDMCECPRNKMCSCEAITAYSRACERKGIQVGWSPQAECEAQVCPEGAMFDVCGPACVKNCRNRHDKKMCDKPCVAGCHCKAGYVMYRSQCIKEKYCPY
ncbi:BMP-binding endothelial regulator protein-like [Antedon mediterranea]|uniref:BMP-binding endothelial regulator protein-like n=1 Tax=Antedon mediterranea TaxID=105859 RepID=UPI003AF5C346